jgi:hypothetical protein
MRFAEYTPREYVDYEGVLIPLDGLAAAAHLASCVLMIGFLVAVALVTRPVEGGSDGGDCPGNPRWPSVPRWPRGRRIGLLLDEVSSASSARWN